MYFRSAYKDLRSHHSVSTTSKKINQLKNQRRRKHRVTEQTAVPGVGGRQTRGFTTYQSRSSRAEPLPALGWRALGRDGQAARGSGRTGPRITSSKGTRPDVGGRPSPLRRVSLPGARSVSSGDGAGKEPFETHWASVPPKKGAHRCSALTAPPVRFLRAAAPWREGKSQEQPRTWEKGLT